ncbi:MAG: transcriptional repressor [Phycisphaerae bacterium]|nr:transcriptional repressor [Phycisphaerae bacterium]
MDAKEKFAGYLKDKDLRQSQPRDIVVDVFLRTERHVTTQELFQLVQKKNPRIGYATVSRTLKLLTEAGLCRTVDFADGAQRFEHEYGHEHHDHLICTRCGAFVEIYSRKLEIIQDELVRQHGYEQISHKLQIFGICPKCLKKHKS